MPQKQQQVWHLIWVLARTDFVLRYQGSVFGFLWALLKPLFVFLILYLVFSQLFAGSVPYYSLQLLMGIFLWNFFAEGTTAGLLSFAHKSHMLRNVAFPRWIVVVASSLQSFMTFLITLGIFFVALFVFQVSVQAWQLVLFLGYVLLLYLLVLGFSLLTAPLFVRFHDLNQIWEVLLLGGFYAAPVIYPLHILPGWLQPWLYLNPITFLVQHSKAVLFAGDLARLDHHLIYTALVIGGLIFSCWLFSRLEARSVEYL